MGRKRKPRKAVELADGGVINGTPNRSQEPPDYELQQKKRREREKRERAIPPEVREATERASREDQIARLMAKSGYVAQYNADGDTRHVPISGVVIFRHLIGH